MANSKTKSLVSIDVGGTNARFALAEVNDGKVVTVAEPTTFATGSVAGLAAAWQRFEDAQQGDLPRAAAIAVAGPVSENEIRFTNSHWVIRPADIGRELGVVST